MWLSVTKSLNNSAILPMKERDRSDGTRIFLGEIMFTRSHLAFTKFVTLLATVSLVVCASACKSTGSSGKNGLASADQSGEAVAKLRYHVTQYQGKVAYATKPDYQTCNLYIYKSNQDGKVAAVKFSGGTREFEMGSYKVGGVLEPNKDRIDMKVDLARQDYKELAGYTRIAHSEETEKKSITASGLIVVDVAVIREDGDVFGTVVGSEVHRMKLIGGLVMDDSSRERETVTCNYVKKVSDKETDDIDK